MTPVIAAAAAFGLAAGVHLGAPWAYKVAARRRFLREAAGPAVYLTFDDGPDPRATPAVLDLLAGAGARATFFVRGRRAAAAPELVRRMVAEGHGVGEHGYDHPHAWRASPWATWRDLVRAERVLRELLGRPSPLLRPPFGKLNAASLWYVWRRGKCLVFWDLDPRDYAARDPAAVVRAVLERVRPGSVVLLHDGRLDPARSPWLTVQALERLLPELVARGWPLGAFPVA